MGSTITSRGGDTAYNHPPVDNGMYHASDKW